MCMCVAGQHTRILWFTIKMHSTHSCLEKEILIDLVFGWCLFLHSRCVLLLWGFRDKHHKPNWVVTSEEELYTCVRPFENVKFHLHYDGRRVYWRTRRYLLTMFRGRIQYTERKGRAWLGIASWEGGKLNLQQIILSKPRNWAAVITRVIGNTGASERHTTDCTLIVELPSEQSGRIW